jgi:hypothetical protein
LFFWRTKGERARFARERHDRLPGPCAPPTLARSAQGAGAAATMKYEYWRTMREA